MSGLERKLNLQLIGQMQAQIAAGKFVLQKHRYGRPCPGADPTEPPFIDKWPTPQYIEHLRRRREHRAEREKISTGVIVARAAGGATRTVARKLMEFIFGPGNFSVARIKKARAEKPDAAGLEALRRAEERRVARREKRARS